MLMHARPVRQLMHQVWGGAFGKARGESLGLKLLVWRDMLLLKWRVVGSGGGGRMRRPRSVTLRSVTLRSKAVACIESQMQSQMHRLCEHVA